MTKLYLSSIDLEKFLYQNKAVIVDCVEGCLIDNILCETKRGLMTLTEHYLNCWTSDYLVTFGTTEEEKDTLYNDFQILSDNYYEAVN